MDRFGRKKIIVGKVILSMLMLIPLIPLGLLPGNKIEIVLFFYFGALLASTFTFDLFLYGFEMMPKENRDNYVILLSATKIVGIAIVSLSFYFMSKWVYFIIL